jgi:very-short-patch-repair endonuclease
MTKAEAYLWKYALKSRHIKGYGFRSQRPVQNYIAGFMCPELLLIHPLPPPAGDIQIPII